MALLTMTPTIVAAVQACHDLEGILPDNAEEPSLADPAVGNPISHIQLIAISKQLRKQRKKLPSHSSHLDNLLRGSKIYIEVPPPKAEPVCRLLDQSMYPLMFPDLRVQDSDGTSPPRRGSS